MAVLRYFHEVAIAHAHSPLRDDYHLQATVGYPLAMIFVGGIFFLFAPFFTGLKIQWKAVGSLIGIAVYCLILKGTALARIAIAGAP